MWRRRKLDEQEAVRGRRGHTTTPTQRPRPPESSEPSSSKAATFALSLGGQPSWPTGPARQPAMAQRRAAASIRSAACGSSACTKCRARLSRHQSSLQGLGAGGRPRAAAVHRRPRHRRGRMSSFRIPRTLRWTRSSSAACNLPKTVTAS